MGSRFAKSRVSSGSVTRDLSARACGGAQLHHETIGSTLQRLEVVMAAEGHSFGVDGVSDENLASRDAGSVERGVQRPHEEFDAETLSVEVLAQGKLGQQDRRDLTRGSRSELLRCDAALFRGSICR